MEEIQLTPTSYVILGLLTLAGEATPYDLKRMIAATVGHFWSLPHSAIYAEPERLVRGGYVEEDREQIGRRRRRYSLTDRGRAALEKWANTPTGEVTELRDLATLKLFFGGDPAQLANAQLETFRAAIASYEELKAADPGSEPRGPWLALEAGIGHARESIRFWEDVLAREQDR
jgi:DNA-binding PadR family transcriptional regulator